MRRYGAWAGSPRGYHEHPDRCIVQVSSSRTFRGTLYKQCTRKRIHSNGMCQQHSNMAAAGHHLNIPKDEVVQ